MKKVFDINFSEILPQSLADDKNLGAVAKSLDNSLKKVSAETQLVLLYARLDELDSKTLDLLANQFHVDFYDAVNFSIDEKRNAIRQSIAVHRLKGTVAAVEKVAKEFLENAKVVELGNFRFGLWTTNYIGSENALPSHLRRLYDAKNVRSWLDYIELDLSDEKNNIHLTAGSAQIISGLLKFPLPKPKNENINLSVGSAQIISGVLKLGMDKTLPAVAVNIKVACAEFIEGTITLDCEPPPKPPIKESPIADLAIAGIAIARGGSEFIWDDLDYDYLKLFFKFPLGRAPRPRSLLLREPRDDITADDIKNIGNYVAEKQIIMNADGEFATGINRYAVRTKSYRKIKLV